MNRKKELAGLFLTMLKIGAFTFGGGYAMIALMQRETVEKKEWLGRDEFLDLVAIAESTPGPIAINGSTYIGYRVAGLPGAILSTLAMCIPSFTVICLISLFFDAFLSIRYVKYAFEGIQTGVIFLILSAGIRMFRGIRKDLFSMTVFGLTFAAMLAGTFFATGFSSVYCILISGTLGLFVYLIGDARKRRAGK